MKHTIVKASDLGEDWTAEHHIAKAEAAAKKVKPCVTCGGPTDDVGWSECNSCFNADQFSSFNYWLQPLSAVLFVVALCFIIAAIAKLS